MFDRRIVGCPTAFTLFPLSFADWTQVFGEQAMTTALLDRLTHKARLINCIW